MPSFRRVFILIALVAPLAFGGCRPKAAASHTYTLQGQVLSVRQDHQEATVKHEEIKGFMPAMTMPYKIHEPKELDGVVPGDLINATLVVLENDAYLVDVKKVGSAPLEKQGAPTASSGFELLREGQPIPATALVDQDGKAIDIPTAFANKAVVLTFTYTTCPMPTFCPLMDRNFAAIQKKLKADPALDAHLVTISIDPLTDTPPVLKKHAAKLGADPTLWTFVTGDRDTIDQFGMRFGLSTTRAMNDQKDITHTLRTVIIDRHGKLAKTITGNEWTPDQVVADVKGLVGTN